MEKRKKLDEKTKADIIRSCKTSSIKRVAEHYGVHSSTIRRILKQDVDKRVMASPEFRQHASELVGTLRWLMQKFQLLHDTLTHFKQEYPEFAYLRDWQDITREDINRGILNKMWLLADSRAFHVPSQCPACQALRKRLRE